MLNRKIAMSPRRLSGITLRCLCYMMIAFSPVTWSIGTTVLALSADTINIGFIAIVIFVLLLLIALFLFKSKVKRSQRIALHDAEVIKSKQSLLDGFETGIVHLDPQGVIQYTNKVAAVYLSHSGQNEDGRQLVECVSEDQQEKLQQAIESDVYTQVQIELSEKNKHLLFGFTPKKNVRNNIATIVSISDISQYQEVIDQKIAANTRKQALLDHSQIGQVTIDFKDDNFIANQVLVTMLNGSGDSIEGPIEQWQQLIHNNDIHLWNQAIGPCERGEPLDIQCRLTLNEVNVPVRIFALPSHPNDKGDYQIIQMTIINCTEEENQKSEASTYRQRTKGLLSGSSHAVYVLNDKQQLLECNSAFEKLFSVSSNQVVGQKVTDIEAIPESIRGTLVSSNAKYASLSSSSSKEIQVDFSEDKSLTLKVKSQSFKNSEGEVTSVVGSIEDITPFKMAQHELEQAKKHFAHTLDLAPMAIAMVDAEDNIIQTNRTLVERLGIDEKELLKSSFYQLFHDPANAGKAAKQLHNKGLLRGFRAHLKGKTNDLHPSILNMDVFQTEPRQYLCWISDSSGEQFHQDKFEGLLEHSSMPMAVLSSKGFSQLNPAACDFFAIEDESELFGFFPYSESLNSDSEQIEQLKQKIEQIKQDGRAQSMQWQHQINGETLPCQATFVPMFKGKKFDSILCIWTDLRAITRADEERLAAINLHQAAERQVQEKQQLLANSQDQLASKARSLADTETKLQAAQSDLSEKLSKISDLQAAHQNVTEHLSELQQDYSESRSLLDKSQQANAELESQLEKSSVRVSGLEKQRNEIADALQYSERKFQDAKQQLQESEETSERLKQEQVTQQHKMQEFVDEISNLKQSITQKDKQINDVSGQITALQSQLSSSGQTSEKLRQLLINQRKASEQAEQERRELEQTCFTAQAELSNKGRHIEHLQHEMEKFEEMSQQQKGDMEQQQKALQKELEAKHNQLQETQAALSESQRQAEQDRKEKEQQQQALEKIQQELAEVEERTNEQMQKMAESDQYWLEQQQLLQEELKAKQQKLQETEQVLNDTKQQTEVEKEEKERQQEIFEKLQSELSEVEQRVAEQQQKMSESDDNWKRQQQQLSEELKSKQQQLQQTQEKLNDNQKQVDAEKQQSIEQQKKLEQLKVELSDVESRAVKQKEMLEGSDEQWRQHHAEIEQQKKQLQQALQEAEKQNAEMKQALSGQMDALQKAESQVSATHSDEKKLQQELEQAKQQARELEQKLQQQEQQELKLQQQLAEQQQALQANESNIHSLETEQKHLTDELKAVQQEYTSTKQNLSSQDDSQAQLAEQLKMLETELQTSKQQLDTKESALKNAQKELQDSASMLKEQEQALITAHQEELRQAQQNQPSEAPKEIPEFAKLDMPPNPTNWFDLLPYLQNNPNTGPLAESLGTLMQDLETLVKKTDAALSEDNNSQILINVRKLALLANRVGSEPLKDLAQRLEEDCKTGQIDNISIFWPNVKSSMMKTLRVVYSHLNA